MSWFKAAILCLCFSVSACGFESLYAEKNIVLSGSQIEIASIPDYEGQFLRNLLIDRLYGAGRPENAIYLLKISPLEKTFTNLGTRKDVTDTRAHIKISAHLKLIEKATNKTLLERDIRTTGGYNLLDNQLSTITSRNNVTETLLKEISDDAVTEISLYLHRQEGLFSL